MLDVVLAGERIVEFEQLAEQRADTPSLHAMFEAVLELQADFENAQQIAIGWLPAMLHVGFAELQAGPQQNFAQHAGIAQLHARARFTMAKHPSIVAGDEFQRAAVETPPDRIETPQHGRPSRNARG